jgi:hypothetical protein
VLCLNACVRRDDIEMRRLVWADEATSGEQPLEQVLVRDVHAVRGPFTDSEHQAQGLPCFFSGSRGGKHTHSCISSPLAGVRDTRAAVAPATPRQAASLTILLHLCHSRFSLFHFLESAGNMTNFAESVARRCIIAPWSQRSPKIRDSFSWTRAVAPPDAYPRARMFIHATEHIYPCYGTHLCLLRNT